MHEFFSLAFSIPQFRDARVCACPILNLKKHVSASAATFGLQPIRPLQSCMLDHLVDMPIRNLMFGRSGDAAPVPKPMIKRRASPLKEPPARDEEDETSDCPMEQVADENPSASQQPENVNMEQVDYDPDSDDDDSDEEGRPLEGRPLSKAMPHPKLVPKSPPPTLRLVSKVKPAPWMTRRNPTIILVIDLHFQGDQ